MFQLFKNIFGNYPIGNNVDDSDLIVKMYSPFKLAQRLLALLIGIPYILLLIVCTILILIDYNADNAKMALELLNTSLGFPFSIVLGFYFAGGMAEGIISKYRSPINEESKELKY